MSEERLSIPTRNVIVVADKPGQLGNRLTVFAHVIAVARKLGVRVINPAFDEYAPFFRGTAGNPSCSYPPPYKELRVSFRSRRILYWVTLRIASALYRVGLNSQFGLVIRLGWSERINLDSDQFEQLVRSRRYLFLQGWLFRAPVALRRHADAIREFFQPIQPLQESVSEIVTSARKTCNVLVGIHIRQGDYERHFAKKYFFGSDHYQQIMSRIEELLNEKKVGFLVCSDQKQPRDLFPRDRCVFGSGHAVEDLYSLAACDYIIGPPSSYSLWASFYGKVPLYIVTNPAASFELTDFWVAPDIQDAEVRELY